MPNDFPYFPFYVDDFASDGNVEAMTTLEVGSYILLLCKAWKEQPRGTLPADDAVLARWSRLTPSDWSAAKPRVLACFRFGSDGRWHQKRMELEARKLRDLATKRSRAGKQGAEGRWQTHGKRIVLPLPSQCDSMRPDFDSVCLNEPDSESVSGSGTDPPRKRKSGGAGREGEGFAAFWAAYPRKESKPAAVKAWSRLSPDPALRAAIDAGLKRWQRSQQWSRGVIPHASTWLNQRKWEDTPLATQEGENHRGSQRTANPHRFHEPDGGAPQGPREDKG